MLLYMTIHLVCMSAHEALGCTYICGPFFSTAHLYVMCQKEKPVRLLSSLRLEHHEKMQHCSFIDALNYDLN